MSDLPKRLNDLWNIEETERNKAVKLLNKIFSNVLANPSDPKFRDLNFAKIRTKLEKSKPAFYLLYTAGFNQDITGQRLKWVNIPANIKLLQYANIGLQQKINGQEVTSNAKYGDIVDPTQTFLMKDKKMIIHHAKKNKEKLAKLQKEEELQKAQKMDTDNNEQNEEMDDEMKQAMKMSMTENEDGKDDDGDSTMQVVADTLKKAQEDAQKELMESLESIEVLKIPGTKANELKMINDPEKGPSAYQWDIEKKEWKYTGEIMAATDKNSGNMATGSVEDQLKAAGLTADDMNLLEQIKASKGFSSTLKMSDLAGMSKEEKIAKFAEVRNKYRNEKKQSRVKAKLAKERARREGVKASQDAKEKREAYQRKMAAGRKKRQKAEDLRRKKAVREKIAIANQRKKEKKARDQAKKDAAKKAAEEQQNN